MPKTNSVIPNILAERYASGAMKAIWSPEGRILIEDTMDVVSQDARVREVYLGHRQQ